MTSHTKPKPPPTKLRKAKLIERGWTDELVSLYLQPFHLCHGLHLVSDVERIERSAEWKADRAASENMEYISISKTDLKSRGWSLSMMDKLLA